MGKVSELYRQRVSEGRIKPDPAQEAVLPELDRVLADMAAAPAAAPDKPRSAWRALLGVGNPASAAPKPGVRGLYLWGGVGRGKSMLMDLMAEAAPDPSRTRRVHFHEFMQEVQAGLEAARKRHEQDAVRPVAMQIAHEVRLLCFDEMQITDIADAMIVGRLFQVLFDQGVVVVTTSNRVPEDLYKHGLNRQLFLPFIALIRERMQVAELDSERDHRQSRVGGGQVWFVPADAAARARMDAMWEAETDGTPSVPLVLEVKGRKVELPQHAGRAASASFWDVCGRPLGPADYLAIAKAVDVLYIHRIPILSQSNYNEAKRFVTLIDVLYEAKVRLIASAADEPERLYNEGEGSFEFERTASRLREMQDADWGAAAD